MNGPIPRIAAAGEFTPAPARGVLATPAFWDACTPWRGDLALAVRGVLFACGDLVIWGERMVCGERMVLDDKEER